MSVVLYSAWREDRIDHDELARFNMGPRPEAWRSPNPGVRIISWTFGRFCFTTPQRLS